MLMMGNDFMWLSNVERDEKEFEKIVENWNILYTRKIKSGNKKHNLLVPVYSTYNLWVFLYIYIYKLCSNECQKQ